MKNLFLTLLIALGFCVASQSHAVESFRVGENTYYTGLKQGEEHNLEYLAITPKVLPVAFDWREKLGKEPKVLDQGQCGSCWAFSRVMTLIWQYLIKGQIVTPAPQELVSCDKQWDGCQGGYWSNYEVAPGISDESEFPYRASDVRCKSGLSHSHKIASWFYVGGHNRSTTKEEIKQAIFQYGPVGVTVAADNAFANYHSGVYGNGRCQSQTNHMVVLTGWDEATKSWNLLNSWGQWGDHGYMKIRYGSNCVGESAAVAVLP